MSDPQFLGSSWEEFRDRMAQQSCPMLEVEKAEGDQSSSVASPSIWASL